MAFTNTPPQWDAVGAEPTTALKTGGFTAGYKPPAAYFNYMFNRYTESIKELQDKSSETYVYLSEIGLTTGSETIDLIAENVPDNAELFVTIGDNNANIYPQRYGILRVIKKDISRTVFIFYSKALSVEYFGFYDNTRPTKWSGWKYALTDSDIVDNLTSSSTNVPLSAKQGKTLNDDLTSHKNNTNNPHGVTKAQVGLGNVPNVSTNDQTPTYTDTTTLSTLSSGEKLNVAFQKIKYAITSLIGHINTHKITTLTSLADIGVTYGEETIDSIVAGMPDHSQLLLTIGSGNASIYPQQYGILSVTKKDNSRVVFEFYNKQLVNNYIGIYDNTSTPKWSGWVHELTDNDLASIRNGNTLISQNADYADVGEWADGNTDDEDRLGYFVCVSKTESGITMTKATADSDVRGVTIASPAFAANTSSSKYGNDGNLLKQYDYVAFAGFAKVIDNGSCTVNGRCMPDANGCAIPSTNTMGYQVIERVDDTHVLILVEPSADMLNRIKSDVEGLNTNKQDKTDNTLTTTSKAIVGGINELKGQVDTNTTDIASLASALKINNAYNDVKGMMRATPSQSERMFYSSGATGAPKSGFVPTIYTIKNMQSYYFVQAYTNNGHIYYLDCDYDVPETLVWCEDKNNIGDGWSSSKTYSVGDYCIYGTNLWKCKVQHSNQTPAEGTYWTKVSVASELKQNATDISTLNSNLSGKVSVKLIWLDNVYQTSVQVYVPSKYFIVFFIDGEGNERVFTGSTDKDGFATISCSQKIKAGSYKIII